MKELTVSLIIPAYNEEKYIGTCLEHVIKNSNGKFLEIIVIDNASTDNTSSIAKSFPGVRVVHEANKGLTHARQRGYLESSGDVLYYIDADTMLPDGHYEKVVKEFNSNPRLACYSGPHKYHDIPKLHSFLVKIFWTLFAYPTYLAVGYMTAGVNFAIKKEVLDKMNGFDTAIAFYGEDTDIAKRASRFGKVKFSLKFYMPTSGRRLSHHGILKTSFIYIKNYISEAAFGRPTTKEYKDIR